MKKKSYFTKRKDSEVGDLADINEQELAKSLDSHPHNDREEAPPPPPTDIDDNSTVSQDLTQDVVFSQQHEDSEALPTPPPPSKIVPKEDCSYNCGACGEDTVPPDKEQDDIPLKKDVRERKGLIYVLLIALCFILSVAIVSLSVFGRQENTPHKTDSTTKSTDTVPDAETTPPSVMSPSDIYETRVRSSVGVRATLNGEQIYHSGVGIFDGGYIATVYSPIFAEGAIKVTLWNGQVYPASEVGSIPEAKLSLLRVTADTELEYLSSVSFSPQTGDSLYTIAGSGENDGESSSASRSGLYTGTVSHTDAVYKFTDNDGRTRISKGIRVCGFYSGGLPGSPVFNGNGDGIGIILSTETDANYCFVAPLEGAKALLSPLVSGKYPPEESISSFAYAPAQLGISGSQACVDGIWGVEIQDFHTNCSNCDASKKLRRGDLLFRIDNRAVANVSTLVSLLEEYRKGDVAIIYVYRNGQRLSFPVALD